MRKQESNGFTILKLLFLIKKQFPQIEQDYKLIKKFLSKISFKK